MLILLTESRWRDLEIGTLADHLEETADEANKVVAGVETAAEQCRDQNTLTDSEAVSVLNTTLHDLASIRSSVLHSHWSIPRI